MATLEQLEYMINANTEGLNKALPALRNLSKSLQGVQRALVSMNKAITQSSVKATKSIKGTAAASKAAATAGQRQASRLNKILEDAARKREILERRLGVTTHGTLQSGIKRNVPPVVTPGLGITTTQRNDLLFKIGAAESRLAAAVKTHSGNQAELSNRVARYGQELNRVNQEINQHVNLQKRADASIKSLRATFSKQSKIFENTEAPRSKTCPMKSEAETPKI